MKHSKISRILCSFKTLKIDFKPYFSHQLSISVNMTLEPPSSPPHFKQELKFIPEQIMQETGLFLTGGGGLEAVTLMLKSR